jgi:hypothetical protein
VLTSLASIEKVLNLNHASPESADTQHDATLANGLVTKATPILNADGEPIWKVLVFDNLGRDMISSVLRVSDLRSWGVTIHLCVTEFSCLLLKPLRMLSLAIELLLTATCQTYYFKASSHPRRSRPLPCRTYP